MLRTFSLDSKIYSIFTAMKKESIQNRLTWLWVNGYDNKIKPNQEKICTLQISNRRDMFGTHLDKKYGQIQFDRWFDADIFHTIVKGVYTPNEIGKNVNIQHSSGGGSAWLEFDYDKLEIVKECLVKHGYKVEIITKKTL